MAQLFIKLCKNNSIIYDGSLSVTRASTAVVETLLYFGNINFKILHILIEIALLRNIVATHIYRTKFSTKLRRDPLERDVGECPPATSRTFITLHGTLFLTISFDIYSEDC